MAMGQVVVGMNPDGSYIYGAPGSQGQGVGYQNLPPTNTPGGNTQTQQQQQTAAPTPASPGTTQQTTAAPATGGGPEPTPEQSNAFLGPQLTAPYYNLAGVTGNLGTLAGSVAPAAAQYWQSLFNPNLNQMEQSFMQSGLNNALQAQTAQQNRMEGAYENMPFHSALLQQTRDITRDTTNNLLNQASQLGIQRQQLAASQVQSPFQLTAQMAEYGPAIAERMFNLANQAQNSYYGIPLSTFTGYPVVAPTVVSQQGGGGILGK